MSNLYLFDVDMTLVDLTKTHVKAYTPVYHEVTGIEVPRDLLVKHFGLPEEQLNQAVFSELGIEFTDEKFQRILGGYEKNLLPVISSDTVLVLSGVCDCLGYLKDQEHILGIQTGNIQTIGEKILEVAQLLNFFEIFAYSDGGLDKNQIVAKAISEAKKQHTLEQVIVVGDDEVDIQAAIANQAIPIVVTIGHQSREQLIEKGALKILDSLLQYKELTGPF